MNIGVEKIGENSLTFVWETVEGADSYQVYWADTNYETTKYRLMQEGTELTYTLQKATHVPHYLKIVALKEGMEIAKSDVLKTPVKKVFHEQIETLNRGLVAVPVKNGIFLSWRLFITEVTGHSQTGMTGSDFQIYKNGEKLALVTNSTNYLDGMGTKDDLYAVAAIVNGVEEEPCQEVKCWEKEYLDIPIKKPEGGVTPAGEAYEYTANDMSVADVNGDGEYEYIVKWDPTNSHDVSIKGYTGKQYLDCYQLDGTLLWRLDMGVNIRAGAHYTQFIVYDFDGDGKAEMAVKTAPGTKMTRFHADGSEKDSFYITMPEMDRKAGFSHEELYIFV